MGRAIETVSIEDVFPLEDEYGNSMARRDYTLKANKDYVKRLAESFNPRPSSRRARLCSCATGASAASRPATPALRPCGC